MVGDQSKGYVIAKYTDEWAEDKGKRLFTTIYPYLGFIVIPIVLAALFTIPGADVELRTLMIMITMPIVIVMSVFTYFLLDNVLSGKRNPIIIYSNGIEHVHGHMDHVRKIPDFVIKSSISQVEVHEFTQEQIKGKPRFMYVKIKTREGKEKFIAARRIERMKGFREAVAKIGVPIIDSGIGTVTGPAPSYPSASSGVNDGVIFCDACGTRVESGASFCGRCGKKVR